jgi:hypothetical protein
LFDNVISRAHHWTAEVLVKGEARAARLVREERDDYDSEWAATKGHLEPAGDEPGDAARVELQGRGRPR